MKKKISIITILCVALAMLTSVCFAAAIPDPAKGVTIADGFGEKVLGAVQYVGIFIAVGMLIYIGIKYVMAAPSEKGDLKKNLPTYIIGVVLILFASGIVRIIRTAIGTSLNG